MEYCENVVIMPVITHGNVECTTVYYFISIDRHWLLSWESLNLFTGTRHWILSREFVQILTALLY